MSAHHDACGQGGGTKAPSPPRHSPAALSTGREVEPIKPVFLVHAEAVVAGPQRVVAHVPQIHRQLAVQAGLGGQAQDVFQPRPVVTQAQACPVFSTRPRGPGCTAFLPPQSPKPSLYSCRHLSNSSSLSPPVSPLNHRPTTVCTLVIEPGVGRGRQRLPCWLGLGGSEGPAPPRSRREGCRSPLSTLYMFEK